MFPSKIIFFSNVDTIFHLMQVALDGVRIVVDVLVVFSLFDDGPSTNMHEWKIALMARGMNSVWMPSHAHVLPIVEKGVLMLFYKNVWRVFTIYQWLH